MVSYEIESHDGGIHIIAHADRCIVHFTRWDDKDKVFLSGINFDRDEMQDLLGIIALGIDRMDKLEKREREAECAE